MPDLNRVAAAIAQKIFQGSVTYVAEGRSKETYCLDLPESGQRALKVFYPGFRPDRTHEEVEAMIQCSHPNISQLISSDEFSFEGKRHFYIIEEFFAGGTLESRLADQGLLNRQETIDLGSKFIQAIAHIADLNLVHRDIKPANVMFRGEDDPVIVDFGLVKNLGKPGLTPAWMSTGLGTPLFSAPEQLLNWSDLINWRSDQFALGVTLSHCIFGFHPYSDEHDNDERIVEQIATKNKPSDRFIAKANEQGLSILIRMVQHWPIHRFRTPNLLSQSWNQLREQR